MKQKIPKLVDRVCACGCGKSWRCMPESKSRYFAAWHDPSYKDKPTEDLALNWSRYKSLKERREARRIAKEFLSKESDWGFYDLNRKTKGRQKAC